MHVYVVFANPSGESFSAAVLAEFCRGLQEGGHSYEIGDLYQMGFKTDMSLEEYNREMNVYGNRSTLPVPTDVQAEHAKIEKAGGLAFVFPVWWSDCPAKLKGWFDRVWVCGYAYVYENEEFKDYTMSRLAIDKALVLCHAGHTLEDLKETGIAESMKTVFLQDRLCAEKGIARTEFVLLGGMGKPDVDVRKINLQQAYNLGRHF